MSETLPLRAQERSPRPAPREVAPFAGRPTAGGKMLPRPPSDIERDLYFGPQHRWSGWRVREISFTRQMSGIGDKV